MSRSPAAHAVVDLNGKIILAKVDIAAPPERVYRALRRAAKRPRPNPSSASGRGAFLSCSREKAADEFGRMREWPMGALARAAFRCNQARHARFRRTAADRRRPAAARLSAERQGGRRA